MEDLNLTLLMFSSSSVIRDQLLIIAMFNIKSNVFLRTSNMNINDTNTQPQDEDQLSNLAMFCIKLQIGETGFDPALLISLQILPCWDIRAMLFKTNDIVS